MIADAVFVLEVVRSTAARPFSDRGVQLSPTDIFCRKMENTLLLSTVFRVYPKSRILDFSDVVLKVDYNIFHFFGKNYHAKSC